MKTNTIEIKIQKEKHNITPGLRKGSELISLAGIHSPQQLLLEVNGDIDIPVLPDDLIIINGGEKFSIGDGEPPIIDNPCLRIPIRFKFNGKKIDQDLALDKPKVLGSVLKGLDPNGDTSDGLFADLDGYADEPIKDDWRIIIQPSDEFITTPCGNVGDAPSPDGIVALHLSEVQEAYLKTEWLAHPTGNALIIRDFELPSHWLADRTDLMILIPNGYPSAALDMFYVSPHLTLSDGKVPEAGNQYEEHLGKKWQRFSWHYQSRKWNPVKDTLLSHIKFCLNRLKLAK